MSRRVGVALFRMTAAFATLLAVAPDPTLRAARGILGLAEGAAPTQASASETAIRFCRTHPATCLDAARSAGGLDRGKAAKAGAS